MALRTVEEYHESLRRMDQTAYVLGEKITDVAAHPLIKGQIAGVAQTFSLAGDADGRNFSRQILKGSEHTWGIHVQSYGKFLNGPYTNADFHAQRSVDPTS